MSMILLNPDLRSLHVTVAGAATATNVSVSLNNHVSSGGVNAMI
jgi:hypothetical protein